MSAAGIAQAAKMKCDGVPLFHLKFRVSVEDLLSHLTEQLAGLFWRHWRIAVRCIQDQHETIATAVRTTRDRLQIGGETRGFIASFANELPTRFHFRARDLVERQGRDGPPLRMKSANSFLETKTGFPQR